MMNKATAQTLVSLIAKACDEGNSDAIERLRELMSTCEFGTYGAVRLSCSSPHWSDESDTELRVNGRLRARLHEYGRNRGSSFEVFGQVKAEAAYQKRKAERRVEFYDYLEELRKVVRLIVEDKTKLLGFWPGQEGGTLHRTARSEMRHVSARGAYRLAKNEMDALSADVQCCQLKIDRCLYGARHL